MANVTTCGGCTRSNQHSSNLTNGYDVPWRAWINDDGVCVHFQNNTQTNVSVKVWVTDDDDSAALSDSSFSVPVPPGADVSVCFSDFGTESDQVTPRRGCTVHTVLHNDDSESSGVEIWHEIC